LLSANTNNNNASATKMTVEATYESFLQQFVEE